MSSCALPFVFLSLVMLASGDSADLPLCRPGEHIQGKWVVDEPYNGPRPFPCCSVQRIDKRPELNYHPKECPSTETIRDWNYTGSREKYLYMGARGCLGNCSGGPGLISATWVPSTCRLLPFNASAFCELLGNRHMVVIGDSTGIQLAAFLSNSVHHFCPELIHYVSSDTGVGFGMGNMNRGYHWLEALRKLKPDVILFCLGAHMAPAENYYTAVKIIYHEFKTLDHPPMMIWRTHNPGGCTDDISQQYPDDFDAPSWDKALKSTMPRGWGTMFYRDFWTRNFFRSNLGFHILDIAPLYLRGDAHVGSPRIGVGYPRRCVQVPRDGALPFSSCILGALDEGGTWLLCHHQRGLAFDLLKPVPSFLALSSTAPKPHAPHPAFPAKLCFWKLKRTFLSSSISLITSMRFELCDSCMV